MAQAQEKRPISIALSSGSIPGGAARMARRLGLFEKHSLEPRIVAMETSTVATTALISGSVNFTTSGMADVVVAQARGQQMIAVRNLYGGFAPVLVLANETARRLRVQADAPVQERLRALDGVLIAMAGTSGSFVFALRQATESVGARIRSVNIGMPTMVAAMETGAVEGYFASAPYYAPPVIKGTGVIWLNGPKGEFPAQYTPASQNGLNTTRAYAEANPEIMQRMIAVFDDFGAVVRDRPGDLKVAMAQEYPDMDARTLELVFETEIRSFGRAKQLTVEDVEREIAFVKASGVPLPDAEKLVPRQLLYRVPG